MKLQSDDNRDRHLCRLNGDLFLEPIDAYNLNLLIDNLKSTLLILMH